MYALAVLRSRIPPPIWTGSFGNDLVISLIQSAFIGLPSNAQLRSTK